MNNIIQNIIIKNTPSKIRNKYDKIIFDCLLYSYVVSNMSNINSNDIVDLTKSSVSLYNSIFENVKESYISYSSMVYYLKINKIDMFTEIKDKDLSQINTYFLDKREKTTFSSLYFDLGMYRLINLNIDSVKRLKFIHDNIMIPIAHHFKSEFDCKDNDIEIFSSNNITDNIGKEIVFSINNISATRIMNEIKSLEYIMMYIYEIRLDTDNRVILLIK